MTQFSVVMATYDGARFVQEQVRSLLDQTLPPAELVMVVDGSTDGTPKIIEEALANAPFLLRLFRNAEIVGLKETARDMGSNACRNHPRQQAQMTPPSAFAGTNSLRWLAGVVRASRVR